MPHTPVWTYDGDSQSVLNEHGFDMADVILEPAINGPKLAAALDMLSVLEYLRSYMDDTGLGVSSGTKDQNAWAILNAVIAKATNTQQAAPPLPPFADHDLLEQARSEVCAPCKMMGALDCECEPLRAAFAELKAEDEAEATKATTVQS